MNANKHVRQRRLLLGAPFAAVAGWLLLPASRAHAQQKASLRAKPVAKIPASPEDPAWENADAIEIPLSPQAMVKPRRYEVSITNVAVRALYDEDRLALRLEWRDVASDAMKGGAGAFRDALDSLPVDEITVREMVAEARASFELHIRFFEELDTAPLQPSSSVPAA